jgi:hypothetical protein
MPYHESVTTLAPLTGLRLKRDVYDQHHAKAGGHHKLVVWCVGLGGGGLGGGGGGENVLPFGDRMVAMVGLKEIADTKRL